MNKREKQAEAETEVARLENVVAQLELDLSDAKDELRLADLELADCNEVA